MSDGEVPFDDWPGSPTEPVAVAAAACTAAKAFSGRWSHYTPAANAAGTRVGLLIEHHSFELPPIEPARVMRVLAEGLQTQALADHRRALNSYAFRRGLSAVFSPDGGELLLGASGFGATVSFDAAGRVSAMHGDLSAR